MLYCGVVDLTTSRYSSIDTRPVVFLNLERQVKPRTGHLENS